MMTSEMEYYFLSWLISTPDRALASKVELHVWKNTFVPQPKILASYLAALEDSEEEGFVESAKRILHESGLEFVSAKQDLEAKGLQADQQSVNARQHIPLEVIITPEMALANEEQDARNFKF